jgi:hypothetical protein
MILDIKIMIHVNTGKINNKNKLFWGARKYGHAVIGVFLSDGM